MRKLRIIFEEPSDPKNYPRTNVYVTSYGVENCWALYIGDSRFPEIRIVKQNNILRTAYLLLHELGHWILDCICIHKSTWIFWNMLYDKIDKKLVKWNESHL